MFRRLAGISSAARRLELKVLAGAAIIALAAIALVVLTGAVLDGTTQGFDEWVLRAFRESANADDPLGPPWFEEMVRDISALGSTIVLTLAVLTVVGYLLIVQAPQKAAFLLATACAGTLLNRILKLGVGRPRPDVVTHGTYVANESFPSGHSANSAIVYLLLGMMLARIQISYPAKVYIFMVCALLTVMVGLSRIYLGVHWPTDVIAGWVLGTGWALVSWYLLVRLQPSGTRK